MTTDQASPDGRVGLAHETFTLILDKVLRYHDGPKELTLTFDYYWDFVRNVGLAHLDTVDGGSDAPLPITLHPAGIEGTLSFLGADKDTPVQLPDGSTTILYRIWLILELKTGKRTSSVMLGKDGDTILATANYDDTDEETEKAFNTKGEGMIYQANSIVVDLAECSLVRLPS